MMYFIIMYDDEKNMDVVITKQVSTTSVAGETILHKVQYTKKTTARMYGDDFETNYHRARYSWQ